MINDLLTAAIKELPTTYFSRDKDHSKKTALKLQKICTELKQELQNYKFLQNEFNVFFYNGYHRASRMDTDLGEVVFAGQNYQIIVNASVTTDPSRSSMNYQNSATILIKGFSPNPSSYNKEDLEIITNAAKQANCEFNINKEYASLGYNSYNPMINSGVIDLEKDPTAIKTIGDILTKVQIASAASQKYLKDKYSERK
jgi:hypothetical protein